MTDNLGRFVLESGAMPFEIALADTDADHIQAIEADLIRANRDPYRVKAENLLFLAFSKGVQLWDDDWPEATKRAWIANHYRFQALRGTEAGIRMALDLWGYELADVLVPPQGFYASEELTPEARDAWIAQMPQLRIRQEYAHGYSYPDEWIAGQSFAGEAFATPNDAPLLMGRRGFIRRNGVDTPLDSEIVSSVTVNGETTDVETVYVPGRSTVGFFAGVDFAGDDHYAGSAEIEAEIVTVRKNQAYSVQQTTYGITSVRPSEEPLDIRWQQISDVGNGGPYFYAGHDYAGDGFTANDYAADLLYDILYLFDPTVAVPMTNGASFAGVSRVGIEQNTAELLIDLKTKAAPGEWYAGVTFVGEGFAVDDDGRDRENALRAVTAAKALRDTVLVSFQARRPLEVADLVLETTKAGAWVTNLL